MKQIWIILGVILVFPLIISLSNANGLVLTPNSTSVTKNFGSDYQFNLTINNTEPLDFYNISLKSNAYASMPNISFLPSGQAVIVPVTIDSDYTGNIQLTIYGYYYSNLGMRFETHNVIVNPYQSDPCSMSIIRGDSVNWTSYLINTINMRYYPSNAPVDGAILSTNQSFILNYNDVGSTSYQWFIESWGFGQICTISVLPESGYINDPLYDGILNVSLITIYEPTNLTAQLFTNNYTVDFFSGATGSVYISNIGNKTAKSIHLSGDWFTFDENNFDLLPGYSRAVTYHLVPIITSTEQTNKSYAKSFSITGNFPTVLENFNVFINYAIVNSNMTGNSSNFKDWLCANYPEFCEPQIVYQYITNASDNTTLTITAEQWRDYNLRLASQDENILTTNNVMKSDFSNISGAVNDVNNKVDTLLTHQLEQDQKIKDNEDNQRLAWITIVCLVIFAIIAFIIYKLYYRKKRSAIW